MPTTLPGSSEQLGASVFASRHGSSNRSPSPLRPHRAPSVHEVVPPPDTLHGLPQPGAEEYTPSQWRHATDAAAGTGGALVPRQGVRGSMASVTSPQPRPSPSPDRYSRAYEHHHMLAAAASGNDDADCFDANWYHVVQNGKPWGMPEYGEHAYRAWADATRSPPVRRVAAEPPPRTTVASLWHDVALSPAAARCLGRRLRGFGFFTDPRFQNNDTADPRYEAYRQARPVPVRGRTDHSDLIEALTKIERIILKNQELTLPESPTPSDVEAQRAPYGMSGPLRRPNVHPAGFCVLCRFRPRPLRGESVAQWQGAGVQAERDEMLLFRRRDLADTSGAQRIFAAAGWVWPESLRSHYLPLHNLDPAAHPGLGEFRVAMVAFARQLPDDASDAIYADGRRVPISGY